jgi:NAD(P)-dependent dehydrogenase (short-subunit alcohol dehydrogenase family)
VLITGAARGIGAEAARQLYGRGAQLSLVGLEPEELERRAGELGSRAAWFEADVTDWDALRRAVDATVERFGGIDVVIANAGVAPVGTVATIDPAAFERTIEVNLLGVWRTVRTTLPHVIERRGYVLPIASLAAALHLPLLAHYSATKAGVEAFSDSLRGEIAHTGTKVGVAYFSFIDTDMTREGIEQTAANRLRESSPGPVSSVAPLPVAGRAIVRGVERRARHVYAPRWVPAALRLRGFLQPLLERQNRDGIEEAVRQAEAEGTRNQPLAAHRAR